MLSLLELEVKSNVFCFFFFFHFNCKHCWIWIWKTFAGSCNASFNAAGQKIILVFKESEQARGRTAGLKLMKWKEWKELVLCIIIAHHSHTVAQFTQLQSRNLRDVKNPIPFKTVCLAQFHPSHGFKWRYRGAAYLHHCSPGFSHQHTWQRNLSLQQLLFQPRSWTLCSY